MTSHTTWTAALALAALVTAAAPADAQHDPRDLPKDLNDVQIRLFDEYQRADGGRKFYGRFRRTEAGTLWRDDKKQYLLEIDQRIPAQKNSPTQLRIDPGNIGELEFRQLPHEVHRKLFRKRYPEASRKKPDRGAMAAMGKDAIQKADNPKPDWAYFPDEIKTGLLDVAAEIYEAVNATSPDWAARRASRKLAVPPSG